MKRREREGRRKRELPEGSCLGHAVKSRMTVINRWSAIMITGADGVGSRDIKAWDAGHLSNLDVRFFFYAQVCA